MCAQLTLQNYVKYLKFHMDCVVLSMFVRCIALDFTPVSESFECSNDYEFVEQRIIYVLGYVFTIESAESSGTMR